MKENKHNTIPELIEDVQALAIENLMLSRELKLYRALSEIDRSFFPNRDSIEIILRENIDQEYVLVETELGWWNIWNFQENAWHFSFVLRYHDIESIYKSLNQKG